MVGWKHHLSVHGFGQTLGDSEGQGSLVCCSPWGHKESDMTERLNNNGDFFELHELLVPLEFQDCYYSMVIGA